MEIFEVTAEVPELDVQPVCTWRCAEIASFSPTRNLKGK